MAIKTGYRKYLKQEQNKFVPGTFNDTTLDYIKSMTVFRRAPERVMGTRRYIIGWNTTEIDGFPVTLGYETDEEQATKWLRAEIEPIAAMISAEEPMDQKSYNERVYKTWLKKIIAL